MPHLVWSCARQAGPAPGAGGQLVAGEVLAGIDVLARDDFALLAGRRVGLVTNTTGRARSGQRTADLLHEAPGVELVRLFSPEHGFAARLEGAVGDGLDEATGLPVVSLYGETRRPTPASLAGLDDLVFDLQDVGTRFYTYSTTLGYCLEECALAGVRLVVLDRPNPIAPLGARGPVADTEFLSFICYRELPLVHGLTLGELARLYQGPFGVGGEVEVVPLEGWSRSQWFDQTGLCWIDPSPNMRNPTQALLYPALGMLEATNISVGRGTDEPFERFGAPWIDGSGLARSLNGLGLAGLRFTPIVFTPRSSRFEGERCEGVHVTVVERAAVQPALAGLAIASALRRGHPGDFELQAVLERLHDRAALALASTAEDGLTGEPWSAELGVFSAACERVKIYR